ncbi:hypothetical protein KR222_003397 [Zaprionus bogoriensis]|nr:hypothetical protein KR222_003397 [Zaprionus bogoriensis]
MFFRGILYLILLLTFCHRNAAYDSEIIETANRYHGLNSPNVNFLVLELAKRKPNEIIFVRPYNILEANCPQGYVLANKHCHKRVRDFSSLN